MGLDADFNIKVMRSESLKSFRKFYELQNLMCDIWCKQNPDKKREDFNCEELEITEDILKQIKKFYKEYCKQDFIPGDWDYRGTLNEAIVMIEQMLKKGTKVYYWNWY